MSRAIDHLVLPVRDLEAARAFYAALGFVLTPVARHPWGTANSLVQFGASFLELLTVADAGAIEEPAPGRFSFGAFNRDFLARREGLSMLVLASADEAADRADFAARGLPTYEPFRFERQATRPDGSVRTVAFSLTFTSDPAAPDAGFFTCRQHFPENFWNPAFQDHPNGGSGIARVLMVSDDPTAHGRFLSDFAGTGTAEPIDGGLTVALGEGAVDVLTPDAFADAYGAEALPSDVASPRLVGAVLAGTDRAGMLARLEAAGIPHADRAGGLVIPPSVAFGTALIFS